MRGLLDIPHKLQFEKVKSQKKKEKKNNYSQEATGKSWGEIFPSGTKDTQELTITKEYCE